MALIFMIMSTLLSACHSQESSLPKHLYKKGDNSNGPAPLVIMLHGYGSNADDLFSLANDFPKNTHVVSFNGLNAMGNDSYAWFQFDVKPDGTRSIDEQQEKRSREAIEKWIPELLKETGADPKNVYLFGFSQGAIMSSSILVERPDLIKGIMALSGRYLPTTNSLRKDKKDYLGRYAFVAHGYNDQVLPYNNGEKLKEELNNTGVPEAFKTYCGMGHSISTDEMKDVINWFNWALSN